MRWSTVNPLGALLAVLALIAVGLGCGRFEAGRIVVAEVIPYAAVVLFLAGFCWRVARWAMAPVPFSIPVTCGQQKSLGWIRAARVENPSTRWGVTARMAGEILLFRSLFRNYRARLDGGRLVAGEAGTLWMSALAFHWALLLILLRHLRLFLEPVPAFVNTLERVDSFFQVGAPQLYLSDVVLIAAIAYLLFRRFRDPAVRFISLFTDYFALFLLLSVGVTGILMRYFVRVNVLGVKEFALSLAAFRPVAMHSLAPLFLAHLLLVSTLAAYLPFSKLMHMGGVFLSPTRNLANDSRARRHVNPWNYPVKTHTYAEWEEEFHDKIEAAGIPLEVQVEARDAGHARSN
jgi:[DsrC]-trisulfide reductase subunit M